MITIISIAVAAIAAVSSYNKRRAQDPEGTDATVNGIRQSTSVVLAVGNAIWAVLDALMFLTRSFGGGGSQPSGGGGGGGGGSSANPLRQQTVFGKTPAGDQAAA